MNKQCLEQDLGTNFFWGDIWTEQDIYMLNSYQLFWKQQILVKLVNTMQTFI